MPLDGTGNHFWSVNAEEQFYLVAPLLLVIAAPKFGRSVLTWVVIAILAFAYTAYKSDVDGLASIVFGVLAAVLARRYGAFHLEARSRVALVGCAAMTAVGIAKGINYATLAPICAVSIVLLFAVKGTQTRFGSIVGGMSYPLYLNHWIGVFIGHALLGPIGLRDSAMRVILSTVLGISIAVGHYWFIDRGMLALRRQMFSRERGLTAARVAYLLVFGGITFGITVAVHGQ
jgi:peptidoglycan/LPS O-acetylase OafA/YrhL